MKTPQIFSALTLLATLAGCGPSYGAASEATAKDIVAQDPVGALAQYRLVIGHFNTKRGDSECVALQTKITGNRGVVSAGSEWRTIVETAPYQAVEDLEKRFRAANCENENPGASEACSGLSDQLHEQAGALAKTPQWQTLANNSSWHDLIGDVRKAQKIGCM